QQQTIFEAFRQADGSTHRKYGGTGLGLSISRDLAQLLGGNVTVQSELGAGSVFTLWLPERAPEEAAEGPQSRDSAAPALHSPSPPAKFQTAARGSESPASQPGTGQDFAGRAHEKTASGAIAVPRRRAPPGDARLLLVIEDDPAFGEILRDLAGENGFEAIVAHDARSGLEALRDHVISAVLLDMHLP